MIDLFFIKIYIWGLFLGLSFISGLFLFLFLAKKNKLNIAKFYNIALIVFIGSLIGAKIGYVVQFKELVIQWEGMTFYGGLLGGIATGYLTAKIFKENFWQIADLAVLPLCLGIFLTRIGCFLINDHQGAIIWPDGTLRHPVALYLSLNGLVMFIIFWFYRKRNLRTGQLFLCFLLWYSTARFLLDFFRASGTYLSDPHFLYLTISQWISLLILSIILICKRIGII